MILSSLPFPNGFAVRVEQNVRLYYYSGSKSQTKVRVLRDPGNYFLPEIPSNF